MRIVIFLGLVLMVSVALSADGPCNEPGHNKFDRMQGVETCFYDSAKQHKASTTVYDDGKEIGPKRRWREDGSLIEIDHFAPNVKEYKTTELYYETGGIRRTKFASPSNTIIINYTVSGRIYKLSCSASASSDGGYGYTVKECQPKVSFPISNWKPSL